MGDPAAAPPQPAAPAAPDMAVTIGICWLTRLVPSIKRTGESSRWSRFRPSHLPPPPRSLLCGVAPLPKASPCRPAPRHVVVLAPATLNLPACGGTFSSTTFGFAATAPRAAPVVPPRPGVALSSRMLEDHHSPVVRPLVSGSPSTAPTRHPE
jgi:hypothetical protein